MKAPIRSVVSSMCLFLALAVLGAKPARAQRAPDLATLDRGDGITRIGLDVGLIFLDEPSPYDFALRLEPFGQYVTDWGLGFYGAIPIARSFGDNDDPPGTTGYDPPGDQDEAAIGNLDLGLLYVIDRPAISWVFRGGVALPTADDNLAGWLTNVASVWPRLTDWALIVPDALYIRLAVSPLIHVSNFYLRADLGLDLGVETENSDADELLRINVGGGYDFGVVALGVEFVNIADLDDFDGDRYDDDDFLNAFAVSLRFMGEQFQPFVAVGLPIDHTRDYVKLFVSAGLQVTF